MKKVFETDIQHLSVELPCYADARGRLVVASSEDVRHPLPFDVRRTFWIKDVPQDMERGGHAHRTCDEVLVCLSGSMTLRLSNGRETAVYQLHAAENDGEKETGVLIPRMIWCELTDFSADCIILCLASEAYDAQGYINSFGQYRKEVAELSER